MTTKRKTNFKVVVIDESQSWNQDTLKVCGGKIQTVYLYDANMVTYCCEITPSYYLLPLYCIPAHSFNELENEAQNYLQRGESTCEPIYMHCREVERLKQINVFCILNGRFTNYGSERYNGLINNAYDYLRSNHQC